MARPASPWVQPASNPALVGRDRARFEAVLLREGGVRRFGAQLQLRCCWRLHLSQKPPILALQRFNLQPAICRMR